MAAEQEGRPEGRPAPLDEDALLSEALAEAGRALGPIADWRVTVDGSRAYLELRAWGENDEFGIFAAEWADSGSIRAERVA